MQGKGAEGGRDGGGDGKRGDWEAFIKEQNTDQLATVGFFVSNSSVIAS